MTVTQFSERAGLIADQTYHNTGDVSNHKTPDPDQPRSVATVQPLTSNLLRCNRTQARAGGLVDRTWISYVPPAYEICPLGFSSRCAHSATGMAQRNVRYSKRTRSSSSSSNSPNAGNPPSLLYFVHSNELQVHSLDQCRK